MEYIAKGSGLGSEVEPNGWCGADVCGADACVIDIGCGANACAADGCFLDACIADACGLDVGRPCPFDACWIAF